MVIAGTNGLLGKEVVLSLKVAFAPGTLKNYKSQIRRYKRFCQEFSLLPFPATLDVLCKYAQFLSSQVGSVDTVQNYLQAIKNAHMLKGFNTEAFMDPILKLLLKGLRKRNPRLLRQALPMTPHLLTKIKSGLDLTLQEDVVFWALSLMSFFLLARKSNMVPDRQGLWDPRKQLTRGQVRVKHEVVWVTFWWSKTIQAGERKLSLPIHRMRGSPICPVSAWVRMCKLIKGAPADPAFMLRQAGQKTPYTYQQWQQKLKIMVQAVGRDPKRYSSHSFRRGGATLAHRSGVDGETIKLMGDWRSQSYEKYLVIPAEHRLKAAGRVASFTTQGLPK